MQHLDVDIMGIAETHLTSDTELELNGYKWFGNNRKHLHVRARTGSGGVGFFIKLSLFDTFDVSVLDDSVEGILWLNMNINVQDSDFCHVCAIYLLRTRPVG